MVERVDPVVVDREAQRAALLLPQTNDSAIFFHADGESFGPQFGIELDQLPSVVLVDPANIDEFKVLIFTHVLVMSVSWPQSLPCTGSLNRRLCLCSQIVTRNQELEPKLTTFLVDMAARNQKRTDELERRRNATLVSSTEETDHAKSQASKSEAGSAVAPSHGAMRHIEYTANRNASMSLQYHLGRFNSNRLDFYKKRRAFAAVYPQHYSEFGWELMHDKLQAHELLRTFSEGLVDLRSTLSNRSRSYNLRRAIEQRERFLAHIFEFDDDEQAAMLALRQTNSTTPPPHAFKAVEEAGKKMDASGANRLKKEVIRLNVELSRLFNNIPEFLEHKLRTRQLRVGPPSPDGTSVAPLERGHKLGPQIVRDIPRVHHANLSTTQFLRQYAIPKKPVIITGLNFTGPDGQSAGREWSLDFFKEYCGNKYVPSLLLAVPRPGSPPSLLQCRRLEMYFICCLQIAGW